MDSAFTQLVRAAGRWRLWTTLAWEDVKSTYRRSIIGVLWISLSFTIFVAVKLLIFGSIFQSVPDEQYGAYLMLGFFCWQFMVQVVMAGPNVFSGAESWIRNDPIELPVFVLQAVTRSLFDLFFTGLVVIIGLFVFGAGAGLYSLLAIPALLLFVINAGWVVLLLGVVCTRFRDIAHLIQAAMRVLFFLTPVLWFPSQLPEPVREILWWNPFAQFIYILRTPILYQEPAIESWIFVGVVTVVGCTAAFTAFALFRKRIVFWF